MVLGILKFAELDPEVKVASAAIQKFAPDMIKELGLDKAAKSMEGIFKELNRRPKVFDNLMAEALTAMQSIFGTGKKKSKKLLLDMNDNFQGKANGNEQDLTDIEMVGFAIGAIAMCKTKGAMEKTMKLLLKTPCNILRDIVLFIPLGKFMWVDVTGSLLHHTFELVRRPLETANTVCMAGVDGVLQPICGIVGGVAFTTGVVVAVANGTVQGVVWVTDGVIQGVLSGTGEVVEAILGPVGTPIKGLLNFTGFVVGGVLNGAGMLVGGVLGGVGKIVGGTGSALLRVSGLSGKK